MSKKKNSLFLILVFITISFFSCTLEKRTYQSGYYIQRLQNEISRRDYFDADFSNSANSSKSLEVLENGNFYTFKKNTDRLIEVDTLKTCSTIFTKDSRELSVIVTDINSDKVSYKMCENPNGPIYTISANQVLTVKFENENDINTDLVVLNNGEVLKCIVSEIEETNIKYKRFDNLSGPNYSMSKSQIHLIKYKNGTKDIFQTSISDGIVINQTKTTPSEEKVNSNKSHAKGFGIVSFIFGILGFYVAFAIPFGLIAIIFGSIGLNKKLKGLAIAGFVLGLISLLLGIVILL